MPGMLTLVRGEWFRLRRRVGFWPLAAIAILVALLPLAIAVGQNRWAVFQNQEWGYFEAVPIGLMIFTPILTIVLAALVFATDLQNGNCRTLAARGAHRGSLLAAKALAAALVLLAYHLAAFLLAAVPALVSAPHFAGWDDGLTDIAASLLNGLLYLALGILLSHWRESTAFTVGVGIFIIAFEMIFYPLAGLIGQGLGWPLAEVTAWTLWGISNGLQGSSDTLARPWFIPIAAGYIALLTAAAAGLFLRADLRAGGE